MRSYLRSRQSVDPAQAILGEDCGREERNHGTAVGAEEALVRRLLEDTQDGDHPAVVQPGRRGSHCARAAWPHAADGCGH